MKHEIYKSNSNLIKKILKRFKRKKKFIVGSSAVEVLE